MIAVVVSEAKGGAARYSGEIANTPKAMTKLVKTLTAHGAVGGSNICWWPRNARCGLYGRGS